MASYQKSLTNWFVVSLICIASCAADANVVGSKIGLKTSVYKISVREGRPGTG